MKQELFDKIWQASSIIEILQNDGVKLKRVGREYVCKSPFASERTPSFYITQDGKFWRDFSSSIEHGGDVFKFVSAYKRVEFIEAVKLLAGQHGIDTENDEKPGKFDIYYDSNRKLQQSFKKCLETDKKVQKEVLARFSSEMVDLFGIGYHGLGSVSEKDLSVAGLTSERGYHMTEDRITFPVRDRMGRVVTFTARKRGKGKPKWINGGNNDIFNKSATLYGLYESIAGIQRKGFGVLTEGAPDVIANHQKGMANAVAPMGTSLTPKHVQELIKLSSRWFIANDGDAAGIQANLNAIEMLVGYVEIEVVEFPPGVDMEDHIRSGGEIFTKSMIEYLRKHCGVNQFEKIIENLLSRSDNVLQKERALDDIFAGLNHHLPRPNIELETSQWGSYEQRLQEIWKSVRKSKNEPSR